MTKKNEPLLNLMNALSDGVLVSLAYLGAVWIWLDLYKHDMKNMARHNLGVAVVFAAVMVLLMALFGLYDFSRTRRMRRELPALWGANLLGLLGGMAVLYLARFDSFSRGVLGLFYLFSCLALSLKRWAAQRAMRRLRAKGFNRRHVIVVGTGSLARQYAANVAAEPESGFIIDGSMGGSACGDLPWLGDIPALAGQLEGSGIDEVVVALEPEEAARVREVIDICEHAGTKVSVVPFYNDLIPASAEIESMGSTRLINLRANPLDNLGFALIKRAFDTIVSVLLLIVLSPLFAVTALGVRLSGPGPILFRQERVGRGKKHFTMYKFRSMKINTEENSAWSTNTDPRRTPFGTFIRKFSIDELPQLINVLRGEMSLVGPRPEIPYYVEQFKDSVPLYMVKHQVRPGMTGWAQVNGWRGDTSIVRRIEYDIWYIEHWSIRLDLKILLMTALGGAVNREKMHMDN